MKNWNKEEIHSSPNASYFIIYQKKKLLHQYQKSTLVFEIIILSYRKGIEGTIKTGTSNFDV